MDFMDPAGAACAATTIPLESWPVKLSSLAMGLIRAKIRLSNPSHPELSALEVDALVDTGAVTMCVPEQVALQLQIKELERREVTVADGRKQLVGYAGPLQVVFENRHSFGGALVMGNEVILGAIAMEDMDLVINPTRTSVIVNPKSPNFPAAIVKSAEKSKP
jgi:clan AA aspartic protease